MGLLLMLEFTDNTFYLKKNVLSQIFGNNYKTKE